MNKKNTKNIRSSSAEYLTFISATGDTQESIEIRYECDELNNSVVKKYLITYSDEKKYNTITLNFYLIT